MGKTVLFVLLVLFMNGRGMINQVPIEPTTSMVIQGTSDNFQEEVIESKQLVLLDFYADWCKPCQMVSPLIDELAKEHKDIKFVKINIDEESELFDQYQLEKIPALLVIENGEVVDSSVGYMEKDEIEKLITR